MHITAIEKCELCHKPIYTHDVILVCSNENKTYHAKCLKIDTDTAHELQKLSDWCCPLCLKDIFPNFNDHSNNLTVKCHSCTELISSTRHCVMHCAFCDNICHKKCITQPFYACKPCETRINSDTPDDKTTDFNEIYSHICFNPFEFNDDTENDTNHFMDDDIADYSETLETAKNVLNNCKYYNIDNISQAQLIGTSFYFNNIDGFQTNFVEFKNQQLNSTTKFDFYCFN